MKHLPRKLEFIVTPSVIKQTSKKIHKYWIYTQCDYAWRFSNFTLKAEIITLGFMDT